MPRIFLAAEQGVPPAFSRTVDLLGMSGFQRLRAASVVVVGLGGVGSHAAVALVRAGIGRLCLVDGDRVTESSLNRHAVAGRDDVGDAKTEVLRHHLLRLSDATVVDTRPVFVDGVTMDEVLDSGQLVLDAIDGAAAKAGLLLACVRRGLPVASSMGASSRTDPTKLRVGDLFDTQVCPLARQLRLRLRRCGVGRGITVVYSVEPARSPLPPDREEGSLQPGVRHRQPSLSTMPGIFGYALANVAMLHLAGMSSGGLQT